MSTTANTFTLKLDDRDFKTQLTEAAKFSKQYNDQIANSILRGAELEKKRVKLLNDRARLEAKGTVEAKKKIVQINREIKSTGTLITVENKRIAGIKKTNEYLTTNVNLISKKIVKEKQLNTTRNSSISMIDKTTKSTENLANQTIRYLRWAGTIVGVVYAVNRAWDATLGIGIQVNKMMEDNRSGIAALLSANTQMILSNGQVVNSYEKFKIGQEVATKTMDDLRKAAIKTYATFPQLTEIFQQAIGQTLSMGDAFGSSTDEIIDNTIQLSQSLSNIAGAIGMPMDRVREEIRSMLSGNASTDSLISTMLFGSPGEANKAIKDAKARGKDGLTDVLREMLKPFDALSDVDSYTRSLLQIEDAWSQLWSTVSEPLFDTLKTTFKDLASDINDAKEALQEFRAHVNTINDIKEDSGLAIWNIQLKQVRNELKEIENDNWAWFKNEKDRNQEIANRKWQILELEKKINKEKSKGDPNLVTKMGLDSDIAKKALKFTETEATKLGKLKQSLQEYKNEIIRIGKEVEKIPGGVPTRTQKAAIDVALKIQTDAKKKAILEIEEINLKARQKELKTQQDLWVSEQKLLGVEVSRIEIIGFKIKALEEELKIAKEGNQQRILQTKINNLLFQQQKDLNDDKIDTTYYDVMSDSYLSLLDSQIDLAESTNDWANNLEGVAGKVVDVTKAFSALRVNELKGTKAQAKLDKDFTKDWIKLYEAKEDTNELESNHQKNTEKLRDQNVANTINGYSLIAGSMSQMFDEGSREAAAFQAIESGLAVVAGVRAILTAGTGDPYTAIPRMIAMAAMVATTLSQAGVAFKPSSSVSTSYDAFSAQEANIGAGSILGDSEAQSESIQNSLEILEDFAKPEFELMSQMTRSLKSIEYALAGVSANILKTAGFSIGEGFTAASFSDGGIFELGSTSERFLTSAQTGGASLITDQIIQGLDAISSDNWISNSLTGINDWIGSLASKAFGGATTTSNTLSDAGLRFDSQLITKAITDLIGSEYQTIKTTIEEDGGWFHSDSTTIQYTSYYEELDAEIESQFQLILGSLYNTMLISADMLDTSTSAIVDELSDFYVDLGKISLKGKTGEQIEEELAAIFGQVGDEMAAEAFPALVSFQQIGEGLFETLTRVSVGMEEAEYYINKLGYAFNDVIYTDILNQRGVVAVEVLRQSIVEYDEALYGSSNGVVDMVNLISTSASDMFDLYKDLTTIRNQLEFIGYSTDSLTSSMVLGADGVDSLAEAMKEYYENFLTEGQQVTFQTQTLTAEFEKLNQTLPSSKEAFTELLESIDVTTKAGQELWGRTILLSEGFHELAEAQEDFYDSALDGVLALSRAFESLGDSIDKTIETLLGNQTGADSQDALINSYWTKRGELDVLLAKDGDLTTSEQAKLSTLVGDVNSLSLGIQGSQVGDTSLITESLVSELSGLKAELDFDNQILNVRIVEFKEAFGIIATPEEVGVLSALPSYDTGSSYIPYDQTANIHQGEMVLDRDFSNKLRRYGIPQPANNTMSNDNVLVELKQISARLKSMETTNALSSSILEESQYEQRPLLVKIEGTVQTESA